MLKNGTVFGDSVDYGGIEVLIINDILPLIKSKLGCNDGAFVFVPRFDEVEK